MGVWHDAALDVDGLKLEGALPEPWNRALRLRLTATKPLQRGMTIRAERRPQEAAGVYCHRTYGGVSP